MREIVGIRSQMLGEHYEMWRETICIWQHRLFCEFVRIGK